MESLGGSAYFHFPDNAFSTPIFSMVLISRSPHSQVRNSDPSVNTVADCSVCQLLHSCSCLHEMRESVNVQTTNKMIIILLIFNFPPYDCFVVHLGNKSFLVNVAGILQGLPGASCSAFGTRPSRHHADTVDCFTLSFSAASFVPIYSTRITLLSK